MDWHDKRVQIPKSGKICFTEKKFAAVELTFSFFFSWQENHGRVGGVVDFCSCCCCNLRIEEGQPLSGYEAQVNDNEDQQF